MGETAAYEKIVAVLIASALIMYRAPMFPTLHQIIRTYFEATHQYTHCNPLQSNIRYVDLEFSAIYINIFRHCPDYYWRSFALDRDTMLS